MPDHGDIKAIPSDLNILDAELTCTTNYRAPDH
jgi:hypothetical protein